MKTPLLSTDPKIDENALNEAAWEWVFAYRKAMGEVESGHLFNNTKPILREAVKKYLSEEAKNENTTEVN